MSFQDKFPEAAKFWHPTKNGGLTPSDVKPFKDYIIIKSEDILTKSLQNLKI